MITIKNLTILMMGISGVLIFLSVYLDRDTKKSQARTEELKKNADELRKHCDEMMDLVNNRA